MQSLSSRQPLLRMTLEGYKWTRTWRKSSEMKQEIGLLNTAPSSIALKQPSSMQWNQEEETLNRFVEDQLEPIAFATAYM